MNNTLQALSNKLSWQLNDLSLAILAIEQQLQMLETCYQSSENKIINASDIPSQILPEQEMARLNFILHEQQQQDEINNRKTALHSDLAKLQAKQLRLTTELKRLEHYQERQSIHLRQQNQLAQYNQADEWSLTHRERA